MGSMCVYAIALICTQGLRVGGIVPQGAQTKVRLLGVRGGLPTLF